MRLHYVYPYPHVDEVIPLMAENTVLPYLDIPFQHASPRCCGACGGRLLQERTLERIARWRALCPDHHPLDLHRRLSGESDDEFQTLLDWLDAAELDRVGCFRYEPVEGAAANALAAVPDEVKEERWHEFMRRQQAISDRRLARKVGSRQGDHRRGRSDRGQGRSRGDAPEIDGAVYVASRRPLRVGRSRP